MAMAGNMRKNLSKPKLLTSKHVIKPFDPIIKTILLTDAARLHGLGFALIQISEGEDGTSKLVICG